MAGLYNKCMSGNCQGILLGDFGGNPGRGLSPGSGFLYVVKISIHEFGI